MKLEYESVLERHKKVAGEANHFGGRLLPAQSAQRRTRAIEAQVRPAPQGVLRGRPEGGGRGGCRCARGAAADCYPWVPTPLLGTYLGTRY